MALSLWAMTATVGPIAGPALGGWITDSYSWSWIFYINIPVGLFAAAVTWIIYRERESPTRKAPIDMVGLVSARRVGRRRCRSCSTRAGPRLVLLAGDRRARHCRGHRVRVLRRVGVDRRRIRSSICGSSHGRNFFGGTVAISVAYGVFFGNLVLLPQWMQQYLNYRSVDAGLVTAPLGIFAVILAPVMGKFLPRRDARVIATLAFLGFALVFFMRSHYTTGVDTWHLVLPTLLQGIPMALFFVPLTSIMLSGLPPSKIPAAAGLSNFVRVFCGAVGTSLVRAMPGTIGSRCITSG